MSEISLDPPAAELPSPRRPLLRREPASRYLQQAWGITRAPATLAKLALTGHGPRFYKDGRWPLYDPDDLDAWARARLAQALPEDGEQRP